MRIAILDDYQNAALRLADWSRVSAVGEITVFDDHLVAENALAERLGGFDVIVLMRERTPFPKALLDRLPSLKLLVTTGMRNASIDLATATRNHVVVSGTQPPTPATSAVAELTWALILNLARGVTLHDQQVRSGGWQGSLGQLVRGKTLGVIGLGRIGAEVARLGMAFGLAVVAYSQNLTDERCAEVGVKREPLLRLLEVSDFVTLHLVLSERTRGLINRDGLRAMKSSAYLINTSRAGLVDQAALLEALETKAIAGVGLDVFDTEPLPSDDPFRSIAPTSIVTPHLGYVTEEDYRIFYQRCCEDVEKFLDASPINVLNPDVLTQARP